MKIRKMKSDAWTVERVESQRGKRAIVTGGNTGIGWQTSLELARAGADVTLAVRSASRGEDAAARIRREVPNARVQTSILDLANLKSVREFTTRNAEQPLDLLVNNAGIMGLPKLLKTDDGFEAQFGTNYLGHFALTSLLMPALLMAPDARVVMLSSPTSRVGRIEFDNLQSERKYSPMKAYSQSKLAVLMFTMELQRRLCAARSNVMSAAAHAGYVPTNLQNHVTGVTRLFLVITKPVMSQDAARGALPTLFAAMAREARPGGYYGPDGLLEARGFPVPLSIPQKAKDVGVAERLWQESERLTGVSFAFSGNSNSASTKRS